MTGQVQIDFWKSFLDSIDRVHTPVVAWEINKNEVDLKNFVKNYIKAYEWNSADELISVEKTGIFHLFATLNHIQLL